MNFVSTFRRGTFVLLYGIFAFVLVIYGLFPFYFAQKQGWGTKYLNYDRILAAGACRFQQAINFALVSLAGISVTFYDPSSCLPSPKKRWKRQVLLPNHLSELDLVYLGPLCSQFMKSHRGCRIFSKSSVRYYPIIGWFLLAQNGLFVRKNIPQKEQKRYLQQRLRLEKNSDALFLLFLEGARYQEKTKKEREKQAASWGAPTFRHLMIPRLSGLSWLESTLPMHSEIFLTLKLEPSSASKFQLKDVILGRLPSAVHVWLSKIKVDSETPVSTRIYTQFQEMDTRLDETLETWREKGSEIRFRPSWRDGIAFVFFLFFSFLSLFWMMTSWIGFGYTVGAIGYYFYQSIRVFHSS